MSDRPPATVTVIYLAEGVIRIEVLCPFVMNGITSVPGPYALELREQVLTEVIVYQHNRQCGQCDTLEAHREVKNWTDWTWDVFNKGTDRHRIGEASPRE